MIKSLSSQAIRRIAAFNELKAQRRSGKLWSIVDNGSAFLLNVSLSFNVGWGGHQQAATVLKLTMAGGQLKATPTANPTRAESGIMFPLTTAPITRPSHMGMSWGPMAYGANNTLIKVFVQIGFDEWTMNSDIDEAINAFMVWQDSLLEHMP